MTMTNAEWMIKNGYKFSDLTVRYLNAAERNKFVVLYKDEKVGAFELDEELVFNDYAYKKWLDMEHGPILDDAEKRYLSAVIRPFKDDVQYIVKYGGRFSYVDYEEIAVRYQDKMSGIKCCFLLPKFEKGTMYKGMELNRHYTLEELGL